MGDDMYGLDIDDGLDGEIDFSDAIENPYKGMMEQGFTTIIHHGPRKSKLWTYEELVNNELKVIKGFLLDKIQNLSRNEAIERLDEIVSLIRNS